MANQSISAGEWGELLTRAENACEASTATRLLCEQTRARWDPDVRDGAESYPALATGNGHPSKRPDG